MSFDCARHASSFADWLELCRKLMEMGFRLGSEQTYDLEKVRDHIQTSLAWEMALARQSRQSGQTAPDC